MDRPTTIPLRIGDWRVDPQLGSLSRGAVTERLEARTLRLLLYLANRAGDTVSVEELLDQVWSGVVVTQDSVYQAIAALRRLLGDDARQPSYIATVPRLGYRLIASVGPWTDEPVPQSANEPAAQGARWRGSRWLIVVATLAIAGIALLAIGWWRESGAPAVKSVAVLPFLDLTSQAMEQEYVADGITEELINRLSALPGFDVPPPTASFSFKDRPAPIEEIARSLRVKYLLDGSLRESGGTLRVSARLVRASDGFVVWTRSYDRPQADLLALQDDIASEVAAMLAATVAP